MNDDYLNNNGNDEPVNTDTSVHPDNETKQNTQEEQSTAQYSAPEQSTVHDSTAEQSAAHYSAPEQGTAQYSAPEQGTTQNSSQEHTQSSTYSWVNPKLSGGTPAADDIAKHAAENVSYGSGDSANSYYNNTANDTTGHTANDTTGHTANNTQSGYNYYHIDDQPGMDPKAQKEMEKIRRRAEKKNRRGTRHTGGGKGRSFWAKLLASALVFGLVAGSVMYGVNYVGNKINPTEETKVIENTTVAGTSTSTADTETTSDTGNGTYTVAEVAENVMPSMVSITVEAVEQIQSMFGTYEQPVQGSGSGVIVGQNDDELLIATNNHVVQGANKVTVVFVGDEAVEATVKGTDVENDLAVVAVSLKDIPDETMGKVKVATLGDSTTLQLGEGVVAIGNALGYGQSVTDGIVSALDRSLEATDESTGETSTYTGLIQTNTTINPGNSGGALLNMKGEVVGINQAKASGTAVEGMGYAIPISKAEPILQNLMSLETRNKVSDEDASYLGIESNVNVTDDTSQALGIPVGVFVSNVIEGGPADDAGIQAKDIITEFDGRKITTMTDLQNALAYYAKGEKVDVVIQRIDGNGYKEKTVTVKLGDKAKYQAEQQKSQNSQNSQNGEDSQNGQGSQNNQNPFGNN